MFNDKDYPKKFGVISKKGNKELKGKKKLIDLIKNNVINKKVLIDPLNYESKKDKTEKEKKFLMKPALNNIKIYFDKQGDGKIPNMECSSISECKINGIEDEKLHTYIKNLKNAIFKEGKLFSHDEKDKTHSYFIKSYDIDKIKLNKLPNEFNINIYGSLTFSRKTIKSNNVFKDGLSDLTYNTLSNLNCKNHRREIKKLVKGINKDVEGIKKDVQKNIMVDDTKEKQKETKINAAKDETKKGVNKARMRKYKISCRKRRSKAVVERKLEKKRKRNTKKRKRIKKRKTTRRKNLKKGTRKRR